MQPPWMTRQITAFLEQFCADGGNAAWIGVSDKEMLAPVDRTRPRTIPFRDHGGYLQENDPKLKGGFIWQPAGAGEKELWLRPDEPDSRSIFEYFAQRHLGAPGLAGADVQIDHVFPKKTAKLDGLSHVRMLAVPPASNMAAGRTMERAMAARAAVAPRGKIVRLATYYSIGKATGFAGYEALPDSCDARNNMPAVRALFVHLRGFGLPDAVLHSFDAELTAQTHTRLR